MTANTGKREQAMNLVDTERDSQDLGFPNNRLLTVGFGSKVRATPWLSPYTDADSGNIEAALRADYEKYRSQHGEPTWMHLIREEVAELFDTDTPSRAIEEATQVAALCVNLIEDLLAEGDDRVNISDVNRHLIYKAYDNGDGDTITLKSTGDGDWFVGTWEDYSVMEGIEVDGILYSVIPQSGGGLVAVLVGRQIVENEIGVIFHSTAEARAYVQGLTTR